MYSELLSGTHITITLDHGNLYPPKCIQMPPPPRNSRIINHHHPLPMTWMSRLHLPPPKKKKNKSKHPLHPTSWLQDIEMIQRVKELSSCFFLYPIVSGSHSAWYPPTRTGFFWRHEVVVSLYNLASQIAASSKRVLWCSLNPKGFVFWHIDFFSHST